MASGGDGMDISSNDSDFDSENDAEPKKNIFDLPDETLIHIFSFLTTSDVLSIVARVCKKFNVLSKDPGAHVSVLIPFSISSHMETSDARKLEQFLNGASRD